MDDLDGTLRFDTILMKKKGEKGREKRITAEEVKVTYQKAWEEPFRMQNSPSFRNLQMFPSSAESLNKAASVHKTKNCLTVFWTPILLPERGVSVSWTESSIDGSRRGVTSKEWGCLRKGLMIDSLTERIDLAHVLGVMDIRDAVSDGMDPRPEVASV
ncbi:MAG: hypothetical protein M1816_006336 [Peltula sp. TS41687]|nr:MAG: hypothetical protein M1816_006336 [Peltula sp. TS41687]